MPVFGVYELKNEQLKSITAILSGRDTLMNLRAPCYRENEHCFGSIAACKLNERAAQLKNLRDNALHFVATAIAHSKCR